MPKFLRSSKTGGSGAAIELDSGELVYVSIARTRVGAAQPDPFWPTLDKTPAPYVELGNGLAGSSR